MQTLPPQLAAALDSTIGDAVAQVSGFLELAPGIPASAEVLDDMYLYLLKGSGC